MMEMLQSAIIADGIIELVVAAIMLGALPWLLKRLDISIDDKTREYVEAAIRGAIKYAMQQVAKSQSKSVNDIARQSLYTPGNDNKALEDSAMEYLHKSVPKGMKRLKLDDKAVRRVVRSRTVDVAQDILKTDKIG